MEVVGNLPYEVVAAASIAAAASVAVAAACTGPRRKVLPDRQRRRDDIKQPQEQAQEEQQPDVESTSESDGSPSMTRNKRRKLAKKAAKHRAKQQSTEANDHATPQQEQPQVVVDELKRMAQSKSRSKVVYTFLDDNGKETVNYTIEEVDRNARKIAATLQQEGRIKKGDRVMLCYPPGLDFAMGFWGCLYAGAIAIPVYPPYPGTLAKDLPKFNRMVDDSGARVILTNRTYHLASKMATVKGYFSVNSDEKQAATTWPQDVKWFTTDSISDSVATKYNDQHLTAQDLAFFQYSSGSTSAPKAVMVSHGNLKAQLLTWDCVLPTDTMVSWLPSYHDMGLVGFIITPCIMGARCVSMSPISFIKDPAMWMRIVSKYKAQIVCAPNFGYALAARKTSDAAASKMDLSSLKQAICAAEPIRVEALEAFTSRFRDNSGFNPETFNCGYGLAEVTLVATGQDPHVRALPVVLRLRKSILETKRQVVEVAKDVEQQDDVMTLVGCGMPKPTFEVIIVDPDTRQKLKENQVGEVWIRGASVAQGYYKKEEYTKQMFQAQLANDNSAAQYLRSGDMGFQRGGQLFITGRLKDLIIIRGRNVCPQDIELSAELAHSDVRPGCVAAFSVDLNRNKHVEEAVVVVAEVKGKASTDVYKQICVAIAQQVLADHQLSCASIVLLPVRAIPKTTSGKIQRNATRMRFLDNCGFDPKPLYVHEQDVSSAAFQTKLPATPTIIEKSNSLAQENDTETAIKTPDEILAWLLERVSAEVNQPASDASSGEPSSEEAANSHPESRADASKIDPSTPWTSFGLDSIAIVGLSTELGDFLGCVIPPSVFFQYDTPLKLANAPGLATGNVEGIDTSEDGLNQPSKPVQSLEDVDASCYDFDQFPEVVHLRKQMDEFHQSGLEVPYLDVLPVPAERKDSTNFNTYNYLGHAQHNEVVAAAKKAVDVHGTTMSSSPIVGQTLVNDALEKALCNFFRAESAVLFVGGWVCNVTTIDALVGKGDLILCDALNHDSCVTGQRLSGATILPFPHNNADALEKLLERVRLRYRRVLIVIEGVYSMDGDLPPLREIVELKKKYKAMLFLDEAHSFGTMGETGRGMIEHCNVDPKDVDVRMGTMSKALGSVGGFILGSKSVVDYLKYCAGGFVFSVGLAPSAAAAALKSIELMTKSNRKTQLLQQRSRYFYDLCQKYNLPVGQSVYRGAPVVVVIIGSTIATAKCSTFLRVRGNINVKPIVHPAVEEGKCRLRFFISALHSEAQLRAAVELLAQYMQLDQHQPQQQLSA